MISVDRRKVIVGDELLPGAELLFGLAAAAEAGSFFTSAPMTPRLVSRKYSKGRDFEVVFRKG